MPLFNWCWSLLQFLWQCTLVALFSLWPHLFPWLTLHPAFEGGCARVQLQRGSCTRSYVKSVTGCLSNSWPQLAQAISIFFIQVLMHSSTSSLKSFLFNHVPRIITFIHFRFSSSFLLPWYPWLLPHIIIIQAKCFYPARYVLFILCPSWQQTCGYEEM